MAMEEGSGHAIPAGIAPAEAVDAWRGTVQGFLAHDRRTADRLGAVLTGAPDFALGHALKGLFLMLLGRSELSSAAKACLAEARRASLAAPQPEPERTAALMEALAAYVAGRPSLAVARLGQWLEQAPQDVLVFKLDHAIRFVLGDRRGMLAMSRQTLSSLDRDHVFAGYVLGCHAFALEENGAYAEAEQAGCAGLEQAADDAWGLHAVAHVYDMTARADTGVTWLKTRTDAWAHCNNFGEHVWWHLALFHLDRGEYEAVMDLYDTRIRAEHTDDYRDISNGAAMLARLEIEGIDVGDRWEELSALSENRVEPTCVVFADLHYHMALEAAGKRGAADRMIARLAEDAGRAEHDMHEVAAIAGVPMARGLTAFRAGHYGEAFTLMRGCRGDLQKAGGSHAQRDVFSRLMIEAGIRAGDYTGAEAELAARTARRGAEDGFTARRREAIARARTVTAGCAAE
ncbi:MAG: tetratricopeptide repeat protein [Pseudomonadota bacterium]